MMIFKIFDQSLEHVFELNIMIVKNNLNYEPSKFENLLEPWEMRLAFGVPTLSDLSTIDISATVYREIKKFDFYNLCKLSTTYDLDKIYKEEIISFQYEPLKFKKFFINEGYYTRSIQNVDHEYQEQMDEYRITFKDVKFLDVFVDKLKALLKDSSYSELTLDNLKNGN